MSVSVNALRTLSSRCEPGSSVGGALLMAALSCEAATNVQYSGNTEISSIAPSST